MCVFFILNKSFLFHTLIAYDFLIMDIVYNYKKGPLEKQIE